MNEQVLGLIRKLLETANVPVWVLEHPEIREAFGLAWHLSDGSMGLFSDLASKVIEGMLEMGDGYGKRLSDEVTMIRIAKEMKRRGMEKELAEVIDATL